MYPNESIYFGCRKPRFAVLSPPILRGPLYKSKTENEKGVVSARCNRSNWMRLGRVRGPSPVVGGKKKANQKVRSQRGELFPATSSRPFLRDHFFWLVGLFTRLECIPAPAHIFHISVPVNHPRSSRTASQDIVVNDPPPPETVLRSALSAKPVNRHART